MIRACARAARTLTALAMLAGLLGVVPAVLIRIAPLRLPDRWPHWADVVQAATRPDDGHLFIAALSLIAWAGWAAFAGSAVLEALARIRGVRAVHLPGLGGPQRLAAALMASTAAVMSVAAVPSPPSRPPAATAPLMLHQTLVADVATPPAPGPSRDLPTVTVRRGDTLWTLAETHLGTGTRYREIADLNYGRPQPDGRRLTASHWLRPGWILRLPADAARPPIPGTVRTPASTEREPGTVVVRAGDTLWDIAGDRLGDPHRYPQIVALNTRRPQPDGTTLTDPDLIRPGWTLALPTTTPPRALSDDGTRTLSPPRPTPSPNRPTPSANPTAASANPTAAPAPDTSAAPPSSPPATTSRTAAPGMTLRTVAPGMTSPTAAPAATGRAKPTSHHPAQHTGDPTVPLLPLGLGGLAAAALLTHLRQRRRSQQRHRRPGQQIPRPPRAAARAEQRLRAAHRPEAAERVQTALAALAAACAATDRELPRLAAVLLAPDSLDLVLTEDDSATPPGFSATGPRTWRHDPAATPPDRPVPPDGMGAAVPHAALVTLGIADDVLVLVNLEAAGILTIRGTPAAAAAVQRALAVELVTSSLTQDARIGLGPGLHHLAAVADGTRTRAVDDPAQLIRTHPGEVLLHVREDVSIQPRPWSGVSLVTTGTPHDIGAPSWTLTLHDDGSARLDAPAIDLGIDLVAQHLDEESYQQVLDLLAAAGPPRTHVNTAAAPATHPAAVPSPPPVPSPSPRRSEPVDARVPGPASSGLGTGGGAVGSGAPRVLVLGPVTVQGAHDEVVPNRRRRLTELVAYLALHPGATYHQIDEAMWPGMRVSTATRNALVSRARRWMGATPAGEPYLAVASGDRGYRLHPDVTCDWHDFLRLVQPAPAAASAGADRLARGLALVRGRPFLGVDPRDYAWAEADTQQMISAIVDAAHALAALRRDSGDHRGVQGAASQGLLAEPCSELLYRDALRAAAVRGDHVEVARLAGRLRVQLERLDPHGGGPEQETVRLLAGVGYRWE